MLLFGQKNTIVREPRFASQIILLQIQELRTVAGTSGVCCFHHILLPFRFIVHADRPTIAQIEVRGEHSPEYPFHIPHHVAPTLKKRIGRVAAKSIRVAEEVGITSSQWLKGDMNCIKIYI